MQRRGIRCRLPLLAGATALFAAACQSPPGNSEFPKPAGSTAVAEECFQEGKSLVEANCGDCASANRVDLERAVGLLEKALENGFPRPGEALKLLESAYRVLVFVYAEPDSQEQAQLWRRHDDVLERWLAASPHDPDALLTKAVDTADPGDREAICREVLKLRPNRAEAHFLLGTSLVEQDRGEEGVEHLRRAFENPETGVAGRGYGSKLASVLKEVGRREEAKRVEKEIRARY